MLLAQRFAELLVRQILFMHGAPVSIDPVPTIPTEVVPTPRTNSWTLPRNVRLATNTRWRVFRHTVMVLYNGVNVTVTCDFGGAIRPSYTSIGRDVPFERRGLLGWRVVGLTSRR